MRSATIRDRADAATGVPALEIDDVTVKFGGLVAVNGVSLRAPVGKVTGLIGPNGAGKSTTFNVCTGLVTPVAGRVRMFGQDVTRLGPSQRARRGLSRTFQRMQLYDTLSVRQNVELGLEAALAGKGFFKTIWGSAAERREIDERARAEIERCGLTEIAERTAGSLSTGQRRLVELARALASSSSLLLLDEPSSGLDKAETRRFCDILVEVAGERDVAILLVEHDMELVGSICESVYVLDFGTLIYEGDVADVLASAEVRAAYLGDDDG